MRKKGTGLDLETAFKRLVPRHPPRSIIRRFNLIISILALAAVYFAAGKFGLSLAFVHPNVTVIWPPSGIALAALLLWGYRLWPGVFLGAFAVNVTTEVSLAAALGIALGNTLETLVAAWLVNRFANGARAFERAGDIFRFVLLATVLSTVVSATIGVTSLRLGGFAQWERYPAIWFTWWFGDMIGELLLVPLFVIWLKQDVAPLKSNRVPEAVAMLLTVILVSQVVFLGRFPFGIISYPFAYLATLPLIWAAFRFGQAGAVTSAFVLSTVALWGTLHGHGPFAFSTLLTPNESLLLLQAFIGIVTITALVLAAVISEHERAERRLQLQGAVDRVLAESPSMAEVAPRIVRALCEQAGWEIGILWQVDRKADLLRCVDLWHHPSIDAAEFEAATRRLTFAPGFGLPGRVWSSRRPLWVADVMQKSNFQRVEAALKQDLHTRMCFPITLGDRVFGIIECFSRRIREPDENFLKTVEDIGARLGQFIERKRAEEVLRESEERFQAILDNSPAVIYLKDLEGKYRLTNARHEELFRISKRDAIGKTEFEIFPEDVAIKFRENDRRVMESGMPVQCEEVAPHPDGPHTYLSIKFPLTDNDGKIYAVAGISTDITARKQTQAALQEAKEALARSNEELEKRVQERTVELERAHAALLKEVEEQKRLEAQLRQAQKMESIGTLAGGIAHDFNNILNIIRGYASQLGEPRAGDESAKESLQAIDEAVERGSSVVRQLLTLARKTTAHLAATDVNEVISELSRLLKQTLPKTIEISLELDPELPPAWADTGQITQALLNLGVNARDAMPGGGELVLRTGTVSGRQIQDRPENAKAEQYVCIEVVDTGMGMEEGVRNRIFEPFFTTKRIGEGTGLGLAIVYGVVKNHNGFIDVESKPGEGTAFRLYLPVVSLEKKPQPEEAPDRESSTGRMDGRGTILLAEDEEAMLRLLKDLLSRRGYQVFGARDGEEAVDLYRRHKQEIDVVLLDIGLPKLSGRDVIRKMKEENPDVSVIIASGYMEPELRSEMQQAGVKEFVNKPYKPHQIIERLQSLIEEI